MKRMCFVFSKYTLFGPFVYFILQIGLHVWMYDKLLNNIEIISPATGITLILYFILRFKSQGYIPIIKLEIPPQNEQIVIKMEIQEKQEEEKNMKREILEAQQDDESKLRISLDQFKDGPDNNQDNTIRQYNPETAQKQIENEHQHNNDTKLILSGRDGQFFDVLSSPSEQAKMATPNKQTSASSNFPQQLTFTIEKRFCLQCLNEQPIRAKHCQFCGKCIPLYDHHCPWIGVCIGEKNKMLYLIYLVCQIGQLLCGIYLNIQDNYPLIAILGLFTLLLCSLSSFQIFYILRNITTWEFMSWKKISYLKLGKKFSFDRGIIKNCRIFIEYTFKKNIIEWQLI